jgi:hypothetical protein
MHLDINLISVVVDRVVDGVLTLFLGAGQTPSFEVHHLH